MIFCRRAYKHSCMHTHVYKVENVMCARVEPSPVIRRCETKRGQRRIYTYIYMCMYMYVYTNVYTQTYIYVYVWTLSTGKVRSTEDVCIHIRMYVYMHIYISV